MVFYFKKIKFPLTRDVLSQVGVHEFGPMVLKKKIFKNSQFVSTILSSPIGKGQAYHWNKIESPSPKDVLCYFWLKLAQWFWWRRFFNFVNLFSLFRYYLPLEKGGPFTLHLNKLEVCFVPSLVEIGPVILQKKTKLWKVYEDKDGQRTNCDKESYQIKTEKQLKLYIITEFQKLAMI